jgi:DNA-binding HxlR family transcriptional regulator
MDEDCTVYRIANFVGKRWTILILFELCKNEKPKRFSELKKSLPHITAKILSTRLKELEKEGLIIKSVRTLPIQSEYKLTKSGKEFFKIIKELKSWSLTWKTNNKLCKQTHCEKCKI